MYMYFKLKYTSILIIKYDKKINKFNSKIQNQQKNLFLNILFFINLFYIL